MRGWAIGILGFTMLAVLTTVDWFRWANGPALIRIDPSVRYQTMSGWSVTPRNWEIDKGENRFDASWLDYRDRILDRLVNELGINRFRLEVHSGVENPRNYWREFQDGRLSYLEHVARIYEKVNDNDDPMRIDPAGFTFDSVDFYVEEVLIPLQRLVEANGESLFVNLCYVDFGPGIEPGLEHALDPAEYAELMLATFQHLDRTYGIVPDAFEVILEPDNTGVWTGSRIGHAMVAAVRRLNDAGYFPEVIAPSTAAARRAPDYFDELIAVPGASDVLSTVSYHRYDSPPANYGSPLPEIRKRAERYGLSTAMLEYLFADVDDLHADLKIANVSAWQLWGLSTKSTRPDEVGDDYYYEVVLRSGAEPEIRMTAPVRKMAQYFRFVRAGAVRVGATSSVVFKDPVAFVNTDGGYVVIVKADRGGPMSIEGLPAGLYHTRYTTATETGKDGIGGRIGPGQPALEVEIPAPGVITVYSGPTVPGQIVH